MAATASVRRQALADIARSRREGVSPAGMGRRIAIGGLALALAILLVLWLAGFFSTPAEVLAVRALVDQQVAELQRVARNEVPLSYDSGSFGVMFEAMRQVPEAHREAARREIGRLFEAREAAEVDSFFGLPPDQRMAELDRRIKADEERRKAWQDNRSSRSAERASDARGTPSAGGGPQAAGSGGPPGGPGRGNRTEEGRNLRSKSRIDQTTAEERARRTEYRRAKDQRRIQLGLPTRR